VANFSELKKQKEQGSDTREGPDGKLEHQEEVLEREVFKVDGVHGRVVHSPKGGHHARSNSYDSSIFGLQRGDLQGQMA